MAKVGIGSDALEVLEYLYVKHGLTHAEVVVYQCEDLPHFDEVKKKGSRRSVAHALQHTSDFSEEMVPVRGKDDLRKIKDMMPKLRQLESDAVVVRGFAKGKKDVVIHEALKFVSRVRTKGGIFHIPLFDMDIEVSENGPALVEEAAVGLGISSGAILMSGKSYHLWGFELLSETAWRELMYRALLLDRVDRRWVGHRLLDGQANIRISEKRGVVPRVVRMF